MPPMEPESEMRPNWSWAEAMDWQFSKYLAKTWCAAQGTHACTRWVQAPPAKPCSAASCTAGPCRLPSGLPGTARLGTAWARAASKRLGC
eukprot:12880438-Alexandrium_andersonii.AAC.1